MVKARQLLPHVPGEGVEQRQRLDLVVEELDAQRQFGVFGREDVDRVAAHPKFAAHELLLVALVLHAHQLGDDVALSQAVAPAQREDHAVIVLGLADAVDGTDRGDDDHVAPLQQTFGARQAHLFDVLVDGAVFLDVEVALGNIGLGLVIIVIADKVFDGILRKELAKFAVKLCRQSFIGRKDDGRAPQAGDHVGHGEGFARPRHPQQGLKYLAFAHTFDQPLDRLRLVTSGRIRLVQHEWRVFEGDELASNRGIQGGALLAK
jgi:hypothetical protein